MGLNRRAINKYLSVYYSVHIHGGSPLYAQCVLSPRWAGFEMDDPVSNHFENGKVPDTLIEAGSLRCWLACGLKLLVGVGCWWVWIEISLSRGFPEKRQRRFLNTAKCCLPCVLKLLVCVAAYPVCVYVCVCVCVCVGDRQKKYKSRIFRKNG